MAESGVAGETAIVASRIQETRKAVKTARALGLTIPPSLLAGVIYGALDPKAGAVESLHRLLHDTRFNHRVESRGGVLAAESGALLREFFAARRR